jgi:hypothetical protein
MRTFEESELTSLVVASLKSRIKDLQYVIKHPEVTFHETGILREELQKLQDLISQIKTEKLDIRFVSRED